MDARTASATAEIAATEQQLASLRNELETNQGIVASAAADAQVAQLEAARWFEASAPTAAAIGKLVENWEQRFRLIEIG